MRILILLAGCVILFGISVRGTEQPRSPLTLETIFGGGLYEPVPAELRWSPDGYRVAYFLTDSGEERSLWILDVRTGEKSRALSSEQIQKFLPDETSLSERARAARNRYGTPSYSWAPDGARLLLAGSGRLFVYNLDAGSVVQLAPSKSDALDAKFSPDGKWVSFICNHDIWVAPGSGGEGKQLTFGGSDLLLHGVPDWVYEEEFDLHSAYEWAPDSRHIGFLELDETPVPAYPLVEQLSLQATVEMQRYPKAGDPSPKARVGIVAVDTARTVWSEGGAEYIPRLRWADSRGLVLQLLNRAQNRLELMEVDAENGRGQTILIEQDPNWLDIGDTPKFLAGGKRFLWLSSRTGYQHLYLYERNGTLLRPITRGDWVAYEIAEVDEAGGWIYYVSNQAETIGRDLYRIRLDGSGGERVSKLPGTHQVNMNPQGTAYVDSFSSLVRKQEIHVCDLVAHREKELFLPKPLDAFDLVPPEISERITPDGATVRLLLYKPKNMTAGRKYPALVYVYGMPGTPTIQDAWPGNRGLFHQFLVQQGFVVAQIDDRTSSIPGHKYAVAGHHRVGPVAAADHAFAVQYLKSLPYIDGSALGIWGWSGGGFTTAYDMTHTDLFKAGVAGAPVTDWRLYDSVYTERYMGLPSEVPDDYSRTSTVAAAAELRGRLLLIYGTLDDNVHPQNTVQLANALIRARKQFDLMEYPNKTHGITGTSENIHLYTMIYEFLERHLR